MKQKVEPVLRVASVAVALAAVGVLLGAMGKQPYSYYQILRWLTAGAAVLLVWRGVAQGDKWAWALAPLAVLFNPIAPLHFSRDTWAVLDIVAAGVILLAVVGLEIAARVSKKQGQA